MKSYIAIDLKSFYASVECVERGLDPLKTNLVVADESRTDKTICLAVSPALKSFGVPGRPRLYEVKQKVNEINRQRRRKASLDNLSSDLDEINNDPHCEVGFLVAEPRMAFYLEYSTRIYNIYLKYIAPEDIHVYSIDEVFIDATSYLNTYKLTAHELAIKMIRDVLKETGITATVGIGTNMYLAKVAMDIVAKHMPADKDGVRIAELDERKYREVLWDHTPITDFWRVGHGYARRLEKYNLYTMGDIARFSLDKDGLLYDEFGINAELLIDHAWGYEPCEMKDIKEYQPSNNSLSSGQVLMEPYTFEKGRLIVKEMTDNLVLDLVDKGLMTDHVSLFVGYDNSSLIDNYTKEIVLDYYGRRTPKPAHGSVDLKQFTSSTTLITKAILSIYDRTVDESLLVRRINICADRVLPISQATSKQYIEQIDLFTNPQQDKQVHEKKEEYVAREKKAQEAIIEIKKRYGKNSIIKGMNLEEGATSKQRNEQIGGHKK